MPTRCAGSNPAGSPLVHGDVMSTPHAMLDTETLGTRPGVLILSAAFVRFSDEAHCSINFDIAQQQAAGMTIDQSTVDWWHKQDPHAWALATQNAVDVVSGLQYLSQWLDAAVGADRLIWCHGATFDAPLLGALYERFNVPVPWQYWQVRDTRTLYDLAGVDVKAFAVPPPHVALNDAIGQTRAANEALKRLAPK